MARSVQFKAEKGRVLVPVGVPCRFACKYCYTRGGEVGLARVSPEEILRQFQLFAKNASFETIQFGYDGDPFDYPERGIMMLRQLAIMGKNIGFSTKALVEGQTLRSLADIRHAMAEFGTTLSALVSLSCWDSADRIEPHTPTPAQRITTLANFKSIGILTFIAVRPILPGVDDTEYERLADEGIKAGSDGFILGPLYADDRGLFVRFIPAEVLKKVPGVRGIVPWSAHSPVWTRYEDEARLQCLSEMIEKKGGRVFLSSADAVDFAYNEFARDRG